jgi:hypothetical protein
VTSTSLDIDAISQALRLLAGTADPSDPRPGPARAVDALVGLCLAAVSSPEPSVPASTGHLSGPPRRPGVQVQLVVDLPTLIGLSHEPGEIPGLGPVPAPIARAWAADATSWQRLVVDPVDDHLLDLGPVVRRPLPGLDRYVRRRDGTCRFPGCHRPAMSADVDHHRPHRADGSGGCTSAENLGALCRYHHRLKTHTGWRIRLDGHGGLTWTSPTGHASHERRRRLRE